MFILIWKFLLIGKFLLLFPLYAFSDEKLILFRNFSIKREFLKFSVLKKRRFTNFNKPILVTLVQWCWWGCPFALDSAFCSLKQGVCTDGNKQVMRQSVSFWFFKERENSFQQLTFFWIFCDINLTRGYLFFPPTYNGGRKVIICVAFFFEFCQITTISIHLTKIVK